MIVNEDARRTLLARSRIVSTIRRYLEDRSFLEVCTQGSVHALPHVALVALSYPRAVVHLAV
jgi:elongation factor P--beta-lysine ligase